MSTRISTPARKAARPALKIKTAPSPRKAVVARRAKPAVKRVSSVARSFWTMPANPEDVGTLSSQELHDAIIKGLSSRELDELRDALDLPYDKLAPLLGMSPATLHRRRAEGRLTPAESDLLVRHARIFGMALVVYGTPEVARDFLKSPAFGLGWATPLDFALSAPGAYEVESLLVRIEYGVYT